MVIVSLFACHAEYFIFNEGVFYSLACKVPVVLLQYFL